MPRTEVWLLADTENPENLPQGCVTHSHRLPALDEESLSFLKSQHNVEISASHYSLSFGPKLLTGMVTQLIFTVPKKGSVKLHLVNNHSVGLKSLNSLIPTKGGFIILDNLSDLGANIWVTMQKNPGLKLKYLWKSNAPLMASLAGNPHWWQLSCQSMCCLWEPCIGASLVPLFQTGVLGWDPWMRHWRTTTLHWWCFQHIISWWTILLCTI